MPTRVPAVPTIPDLDPKLRDWLHLVRVRLDESVGAGGETETSIDVTLVGLADNDLLQYNSATAQWENLSWADLNSTLDHGNLAGLTDDDHTQYLRADATRALTANWDVGAYYLTALRYISDVATGTQPYACTSTTLNSNLNADLLDSQEGTYYLNRDNHTGVELANEVELAELGTATYDDLQDFVNQAFGSGHISGMTLSVNGTSVDIAAGTGFIASADAPNSRTVYSFNYAGGTTTAIAAGTTRYIFMDYNAGSPTYSLETSLDVDEYDKFLLGWVTNEGGTMHLINAPQDLNNFTFRVHHALQEVHGIVRAAFSGGLILGESGDGNRYVSLTPGDIYFGTNEFPISAVDSNPAGAADTFTRYYPVSGVWTMQAGLTQWPNTQYSDGSDLQTMTVNRYGCLWFYIDIEDNELVLVYGTSNAATQTTAEAEAPPTSPPERVASHCVLVGRYVYQASGTTPVLVQSAFNVAFNPAGVSDHGALAGLTDDDHTQYLLAAGTRALTAAWDAGSWQIRAETFQSDVTTGTAPFTVASTTLVTNLNADKLDGKDETAFLLVDGSRGLSANWDAGSFKITAETFESDVATGTAPFIVASTTKVANLNADLLDSLDESDFVRATSSDSLGDDVTTQWNHSFTGVPSAGAIKLVQTTASTGAASRSSPAIELTGRYTTIDPADTTLDLLIYHYPQVDVSGVSDLYFVSGGTHGNIYWGANKVFHAGDYSAIDHGSISGLTDDDHTQYLLAAGTRELTAAWDAGSWQIRAETFQSDVTTGTAPLTVASTTVVTNLNADKVDGKDEGAFLLVDGSRGLSSNWDAGSFKITAATLESDVATGTAPLTVASTTLVTNLNADRLDSQEGSYYLDSTNFTGAAWTDLTDGNASTAHKHDHGGQDGLGDDDHTQYLLAAGTRALTAAWDAGSWQIRAETFQSDVVTGTAPLTVASTTLVTNLNADRLDSQEGSYYLDSTNFTGANWTDLTDGGASTLHKHDHGGQDGLGDDDHTQYLLANGTRALSAAWDAGSWQIRAETFQSDVATGTAPFTVASTTKVANLNADTLDGVDSLSFWTGCNAGETIAESTTGVDGPMELLVGDGSSGWARFGKGNANYVLTTNPAGTGLLWADPSTLSGNVSVSGTPSDNQIAVWTDANTIEGDANLAWDGTYMGIGGKIQINALDVSSVFLRVNEDVNTTQWLQFAGDIAYIGWEDDVGIVLKNTNTANGTLIEMHSDGPVTLFDDDGTDRLGEKIRFNSTDYWMGVTTNTLQFSAGSGGVFDFGTGVYASFVEKFRMDDAVGFYEVVGDGALSCGSATNRWATTYTQAVNSGNTTLALTATTSVTTNVNFLGTAAGKNLGSSGTPFGNLYLNSYLFTDNISEQGAGNGVTVENVTIKDGIVEEGTYFVLQFDSGDNADSGAGTYYLGSDMSANEFHVSYRCPVKCTATAMYVRQNAQPGAGKSATFTFRVGAADTAITCANSGASGTANSEDTSNTATLNAGDQVSVKLVTVGTMTHRYRVMVLCRVNN